MIKTKPQAIVKLQELKEINHLCTNFSDHKILLNIFSALIELLTWFVSIMPDGIRTQENVFAPMSLAQHFAEAARLEHEQEQTEMNKQLLTQKLEEVLTKYVGKETNKEILEAIKNDIHNVIDHYLTVTISSNFTFSFKQQNMEQK